MESVSYIVIFIMILWYFCFCFSFMISEVCHVWRKKEILFMSTQLDLLSFAKVILSGLFILLFLVNFSVLKIKFLYIWISALSS